MNWKSTELLGYSYYSQLGYKILIPLVDMDSYDFIAEKSGEFIRVNAKLAFKDKLSNSWYISSSSQLSKAGEIVCDVYLVWFPPKGCFFELPGDFFCGFKHGKRRISSDILELISGLPPLIKTPRGSFVSKKRNLRYSADILL